MKSKHGYMPCPGCVAAGRADRKVLVRQNDLKTLSYNCDDCDAGDFAKVGTQKRADWEKKIELLAAPAADPKPAPKEEKKPAPKAAPKMPWER